VDSVTSLEERPTVGVLTTSIHLLGGIERYGRSLINGFEELGWQVVLAESAEWQSTLRRIRGVLQFWRAVSNAKVIWVLHPRLAWPALVVARSRRVPLIASAHGYETWGRYSVITKWALGRANAVVPISKFTRSMMGSPGFDTILLPPTFSVTRNESEGDEMPKQMDRRIVSFVGRLGADYKGLGLFLELAHRLAPRYVGWRFVAAGALKPAGARSTTLAPGIYQMENPADKELDDLYSNSAIVVFPSRAVMTARGRWIGGEGFGITILDAAVHGAVIVTSDEGSCPEVAGLLGNSVVVRPDLADITQAVEWLMNDIDARTSLGARGILNAPRFRPERFREQVANVLQQVGVESDN